MAKSIRPMMDIPAFITYWVDQGKTFEELADENEIMDAETGERLTADQLQTWYADKRQVRQWYATNVRRRGR